MRTRLTLTIGAALLAGCGGDTSKPSVDENTFDYGQIQLTPQNTSPLVAVDGETLGQHLKNGMRLQLKAGQIQYGGPVAAPDAGENADAGGRGNFSETNVHVEGVDEADVAKYDGSHWFVSTTPYTYAGAPQEKPGFYVLATDPAVPDTEILASYSFDDDWGNISSLYLVQRDGETSHVAAVRNQWGSIYPVLPGFPMDLAIDVARPAIAQDALIALPGPQNSSVQVQLVDVSAPDNPEQDWNIEVDGSLIDSRKIGNTLYLITRYDPWLPELRYEFGDSRTRDQNEEILANIDTRELLPRYRIGDTERLIVESCFVQEGLKDTYGLGSLVYITAIDLAGQKVLGSTCVNSNVESMSMSLDALYLTGTIYDGNVRGQNTVIHKFSLAATGPEYEATGSVTGSLGWTSDPVFRMHAHDDVFRIVTSTWDGNGPQHKLSILTQRDSRLVGVAELPNAANPAPIGKPGEDIYAVRFTADRGYIVTFRRTDPLYTLDLSDASDPKVLGELEIPGFATYMHPVGDHLLFTLGHSADEAGRVTGIKADLFDVSGDAPKVINSIDLGDMGSHSEALSNLRALSLLQNGDDQLRIAFPLTRYNARATPAIGLQLLEINGLDNGVPSLDDAGMLVVDTLRTGYYGGTNRAVLHGNAVFFSHNNTFWAAYWDDLANAKGPISKNPIPCDAYVAPSLQVTVFGDNADPATDFCKATVTATKDNERYVLDARPTTDLIAPADGRPCVFTGPDEVGGTFDVHIDMPRYLPQSLNGIFVPSDICHVQTQELRVILKPE